VGADIAHHPQSVEAAADVVQAIAEFHSTGPSTPASYEVATMAGEFAGSAHDALFLPSEIKELLLLHTILYLRQEYRLIVGISISDLVIQFSHTNLISFVFSLSKTSFSIVTIANPKSKS
jgi:hypothetical protein